MHSFLLYVLKKRLELALLGIALVSFLIWQIPVFISVSIIGVSCIAFFLKDLNFVEVLSGYLFRVLDAFRLEIIFLCVMTGFVYFLHLSQTYVAILLGSYSLLLSVFYIGRLRNFFQKGIYDLQQEPMPIVLILVWSFLLLFWGTAASLIVFCGLLMSFIFYKWDSRILVFCAFISLIACLSLLVLSQPALAGPAASVTYLFLLMAILIQMLDFLRAFVSVADLFILKNQVFMDHVAVTVALIFLTPWEFLRPGYVLSLDMIFSPTVRLPEFFTEGFGNLYLSRMIYYISGLVLPNWLVERFIFLAIFFLLPYLSYKFLLPRTPPNRSARIWAALLYTVNPFVYTRFLAGHWTHLIAYALLPWVISLAWEGSKNGNIKKSILLGVSLATVFVFSLHLGVMATLVVGGIWVSHLFDRPNGMGWIPAFVGMTKRGMGMIKKWVVTVITLLILTSYWTIPYLLHRGSSILAEFDSRHWAAFRTASDVHLGTVGNVLALYGFWGEHEPWAAQFLWPKSIPWLFAVCGLFLAWLLILGCLHAVQNKETKRLGIAVLVIGFVALAFSCGVGDGIFQDFNTWLFEHIGFWRGFRDTQKWSALVVYAEAFFGGLGIVWIQQHVTNLGSRRLITGLSCIAVCLYTWPMLFGFWGQLKPVWYPESWAQADATLSKDPNCRAVFLPWHSYLSFGFTNNILIANPAKSYFHCEMLVSRDVELGEIGNQSAPDPAYDAIAGVVTGSDGWTPEQGIELLREAGIHYVIISNDMVGKDSFNYDFIHTPGLDVTQFSQLTLIHFK